MDLLKNIYIVLKKERIIFLKQICSSLLITSLLCSHLGLARPDNEYRLRVAKNKGIITEEQYHFLTDPNLRKLAVETINLSSIDSPEGKKLISKIIKAHQKMGLSQGKDIPKFSKKDINNALDQMFLPSNIKKVTNFAASDFLEGRNCRSTTSNFAKRNLPLKNNLPSFEDEDQILSSNVINRSFASVFKASNVSDLKNKLASNIKNLRVNYKEEVNSNSRYVVCNNRSLNQEVVALQNSLENLTSKDEFKSLKLAQLPPKQSFKTQFLSFFGVEKRQVASRSVASFWGSVGSVIKWICIIVLAVIGFVLLVGVFGILLGGSLVVSEMILAVSIVVIIFMIGVSTYLWMAGHDVQINTETNTYRLIKNKRIPKLDVLLKYLF